MDKLIEVVAQEIGRAPFPISDADLFLEVANMLRELGWFPEPENAVCWVNRLYDILEAPGAREKLVKITEEHFREGLPEKESSMDLEKVVKEAVREVLSAKVTVDEMISAIFEIFEGERAAYQVLENEVEEWFNEDEIEPGLLGEAINEIRRKCGL